MKFNPSLSVACVMVLGAFASRSSFAGVSLIMGNGDPSVNYQKCSVLQAKGEASDSHYVVYTDTDQASTENCADFLASANGQAAASADQQNRAPASDGSQNASPAPAPAADANNPDSSSSN